MNERPEPTEEGIARVIARALGHNDETGMHWDRYILAARLLQREFVIRQVIAGYRDDPRPSEQIIREDRASWDARLER